MDTNKTLYASIHLLRGYKKPLLYKIPASLAPLKIGDIVTIPFQKRQSVGIVSQVISKLPSDAHFAIREVEKKEQFPNDALFSSFIETIAEHYFVSSLHLYERLYAVLQEEKGKRKKLLPLHGLAKKEVTLTPEQQQCVDFVAPYISSVRHLTTLIHGVTGSGKSEVYAALIEQTINEGKSVFFLLPDVSLALQFQKFFLRKFGDSFPIVGFHSASPLQEKKYVWSAVCNGTPILLIGVHLPILVPCSNLGLIIVDEEHDRNFQEKRNPRLCSKQAALMRAQRYNIPIVLGSATPSLSSLYEVKQKRWKFFQLSERFAGSFPEIKLVKLEKPKRKKSFWISPELENEIKIRLEKKEQILIYINRRGYSFFVMCKDCGFVFTCSSCSVSMTVHTENNTVSLQCHYCCAYSPFPHECSSCKSDSLLKKGIGTQHVVSLLSDLFPSAVIARADLETTRKRTQWKETMEQFEQGKIDILVGTQTITKGYHFPRVTLVGIIWGDLNLHLPSYDATERTLQQLIQVAGRAGRATHHSTVIVQVVHDHPVFSYIEEQSYLSFYKNEIEFRRQWLYPPFSHMLTIELSHAKSNIVHNDAQTLYSLLNTLDPENNFYKIHGPIKPPVHRIQKKEYRHLIIKTDSLSFLKNLADCSLSQNYKSTLAFMYAH